jgi:hypothetical protein
MLTKLVAAVFATAALYGISQVFDPLPPSECAALCDVRITDLLDQGPAVTYDWSEAVHGECRCTEVQTLDDQSLCVDKKACSGTIGYSFMSGPDIRTGGLLAPGVSLCAGGLVSGVLRHTDPPPDYSGSGPYSMLLRGCGDSISTYYDWYKDNTPNNGVHDCDVFLSRDTLTIECGVCGGLCDEH